MTGGELLVAAMIGSTAMQAVGQIQSGNAAKQSGDHNAAVLQMNANQVRKETSENVRRLRRQGRKAKGTMNNQLVSEDVLVDQTMELELEALTAQYQGDTKAIDLENRGAFARYRGEQAQKQSRFAAATTLISGVASAGFAGMEMGVFSGGGSGWQAGQTFQATPGNAFPI